MFRAFLVCLLAVALTGCVTPRVITEIEYVQVEVPVRAPCPDEQTYEAVKAARPIPLRDQELDRPATDAAELAIVRPQLGRYEAPDAFADQAMRVIESCRREGVTGVDPP